MEDYRTFLRIGIYLLLLLELVNGQTYMHVVQAGSGVISSPNFPHWYPASETHTWLIQSPANTRIRIRFMQFQLQHTEECIADFLSVYDGAEINDGAFLGRYCGHLTETPMTQSNGSSLTIVFESDFEIEDVGFVLSYEIVDDLVGSRVLWTEVHPDTDEVRLSSVPAGPRSVMTEEGSLLPSISTRHYYQLSRGNWRAVTTHYGNQQVLWSDPGENRILRGSIGDNARAGSMFQGTSDSVNGIAVDWLTGNVYWIDAAYDWIILLNSDASRYDIVVDDGLDQPGGIAIHIRGFLFWTDAGSEPKVERSDLAGGSRIAIATYDVVSPHGITVDYGTSKVYWVDADPTGNRVEMSDLDGNSRRRLYYVPSNPGFYDLTIFEEFLYVTGRLNRTIDLVRKDTGQHGFTLTISHTPYGIVTYAPDTQPPAISHCSSNPCSYLCVGGGPRGYTCLCGTGRLLAADGRTCQDERAIAPPQLFVVSQTRICRFPSNFPDMVVLANYSETCMLRDRRHAVALAVDLEDGLMFYSDLATKMIGVAKLRGGSPIKYITGATSSVEGMAVDWSGKILYWTDNPLGTIEISRYDGSHRTTLLKDNILRPRSIAIDPQEKLMFWTEFGPPAQIERASLDGTERSVIVESTTDIHIHQPSGLVIDYELKIIYYADAAYGAIVSMDYLGGNRKQILVKPRAYFFDLALYKDYIMWTELEGSGGIFVANRETGRPVRSYPQRGEQIYGIAMYADTRQKTIHDPCRLNNGGCQQLCLKSRASSRGYVCHCTMGFTLAEDGRTCESNRIVENNFVLLSDSYSHAIYQVDVRAESDYEPSALNLDSVKNPMGVAFDAEESMVYWTDVAKRDISRASLNGSRQETIATENIGHPRGIGLDPISRLVYWTDMELQSISVAKPDGTHRKTVITNLVMPSAIVLHPVEGIMFWSDLKTSAVIERSYMDGDARREVIRYGLHWPNGLTIDYQENRIYWCDGGTEKIESSDFSGFDRRVVLDFDQGVHTFGIAVVGRFIYWTEWANRGVLRADKVTGEGLLTAGTTDYTRPNAIIAITNNSLPSGINACSQNNGGCSALCLPNAIGRSCACGDGTDLLDDGVTCSDAMIECPMDFPYGGVSEFCDRSPGSSCPVQCYSGHVPTVPNVLCLTSGRWNIDHDFICEELQCRRLELPAHAVAGPCYPPYEMGKMCTQDCEPGYIKTHGNRKRVCGHDGHWLGTPIECQELVGRDHCSPDLQFVMTPENTSVSLDDFVQQGCRVNLPNVDVTWYKDETRLVSSETIDGIFILPTNDLLIPGFAANHKGHYACVVTYAGHECLRSEFDLVFYSVFDTTPDNASLEEGEHHLFECQAKSVLDVITWTKDGEPVRETGQILEIAGGSLLLRNVVLRDAGQYTCTVSDQRGTQKGQKSAWLTVSSAIIHRAINITEVCGTVTAPEAIEMTTPSSLQPRVVGGKQALRGSAPYMGRIWHVEERNFICGATLLNQKWALTAAHCITIYDLTVGDFLINFGDHDSVKTEDSQITIEAAEVIKHEEFNEANFDKDVALIRLKQPFAEFTDYIRPICLPTPQLAKDLLRIDNMGRVSGWGQIAEGSPYPRFLTEVFLPVVKNKKCKDATEYEVTRNMFCAGYYRIEKDACQGDSGGPFAMEHMGRWYQVGVVSWGEGCAQEGKYGYYTKILKMMSWIERHVEG